jgi:hypothetical protein
MGKHEHVHGNVHVFTEGDLVFLRACARACLACESLCWCDVHKFYCKWGLPFVQVPCERFVERVESR